MSDTETGKDVSCFTVDGIVAEMVIEVEENQKLGSDDLPQSPLKENQCFKKNDSADESTNAVLEKEEIHTVDLDSKTEDKDSSVEIIETDNTNEKHIEGEKLEETNNSVAVSEETRQGEVNENTEKEGFDEINKETEDKSDEIIDIRQEKKTSDEIINTEIVDKQSDKISKQNIEDKKSDSTVDQRIEDKSSEKNQPSAQSNQNIKIKRKPGRPFGSTMSKKNKTEEDTDVPRYPGRKRLANKRYISEDMITPKRKKSETVDFKESPKEAKKRKIEIDSKENEDKKENFKEKEDKKEITKEKGDKKEVFKDSVKKKNIQKEEKHDRHSDISKESEKTKINRSLRNRKSYVENENSASKQNVLRKLPFRKNKDAPDVPDLKPKVFWWNGVGEGQGCKLGDIPEIRQRIQKAKSIRALYRVLFYQWPTNGQDIVKEILQFNGFPFDQTSYEYSKRQTLLKVMLDKVIFHMCELLDIRKGDKQANIRNILEFLLKPYAKFDPATDPSWQPIVIVERIEIDERFYDSPPSSVRPRRGRSLGFSQALKSNKDVKSSDVTPTRTTRRSVPGKIELVIHPDPERIGDKSKQNLKTNKAVSKESNLPAGKSTIKKSVSSKVESPKVESPAVSKRTSTPGVKKSTPASGTIKAKEFLTLKVDKTKTKPIVKDNVEKNVPAKKEIKSSPKKLRSKIEEIKNNTQNRMKKIKKFNKRRKKINAVRNKKMPEKKVPKEKSVESKDDSDEYEIEMTIDSGPDIDDVEMEDINSKKPETEPVKTVQEKSKTKEMPEVKQKAVVSTVVLSDSSETESAEETKLVTAVKKPSRVPMKRKGKPLRSFPKISDSIQNANFSALQRLHILLFGASDKAENLKSNILSFGGFPFLEGSDEWKQKHFLLSLLAQNNLREYLNLLCISYAHDDQPTMINKLMKFLAVPSEELLEVNNTEVNSTDVNSTEVNNIQPIETEVVSSVLVDKSSPVAVAPKVTTKKETKKKTKKKEEKKAPKRPRKILMSEEEARRLEANFAREQRALAREKKFPSYVPIAQKLPQTINTSTLSGTLSMPTYVPPPKVPGKQPISDPDQLNALLQTVYKRRALKDAGAIVSTPNKGQKTKLGDIENVKFLIVTSNLNDLEILHRLIYMLETSKSRVRKNILDFDGFGFNEDSPKYKHRMDYLNSLGYEASKRISFLLGLCPLNTNLPQKDLNELIMYFLMSPCKTKQTVPITQLPSEEPQIIVNPVTHLENPIYIQNTLSLSTSIESPKPSANEITIQHSTPAPKTGTQKARKTFPSSSKVSPVKKVLLPPSQSPVLGVASFGNKPQKMTLLNSVPAVPAYAIPKSTVSNSLNNVTLLNTGSLILNPSKSPVNSLVKVPVSPGKMQILNQGTKVAVADPATATTSLTVPNVPVSLSNVPTSLSSVPVSLSNIPISLSNITGQVLPNQILIPQISEKNSVQPSPIQTPMLVKPPAESPSALQEFIVQQQAPDGQQKIFKLIRLPPNHPLVSNSVTKPPIQQSVSSPQLQQQVLFTTNSPLSGGLPPGIVIMKNNAGLPQLQNLQILPNAPVKILPASSDNKPAPSVVSSSVTNTIHPQTEETASSDIESISAAASASLNDSIEDLSSPDDRPPTDDDLFSSIQEIILSSNFEDITLRNVIERVAAQYPDHDLTHRHNFMKECVKKIIIGT